MTLKMSMNGVIISYIGEIDFKRLVYLCAIIKLSY